MERETEGESESGGKKMESKGRYLVAACQLVIRALVCPLWVRERE